MPTAGPPPRILVSFLGKYQRPDGGGYRRTPYRFDGATSSIETAFFGWAAWQHLRRQDQPPDTWVILGTPTSSWDCLYDIFESDLPDGLDAWSARAEAEIDDGGIGPATLVDFSSFAGCLGVPTLRLAVMPMEPDAAFVVLHSLLDEDARIVLDITHALRMLPVLALLALGALRWMKGVRIEDVIYGNLEGSPREQVEKDVVSLRQAARVAELAPSLARIALVDDFEEAETVCNEIGIGTPQERLELRRQSILTAMLYPREAEAQAGRLWQRLGAWPAAGGTMASVIGDWIRQRATDAAGGRSGGIPITQRLLFLSEKFLTRRDYLRCMLQLNEANRIILAGQFGLGVHAEFGDLFAALGEKRPHDEIIQDVRVLTALRNYTAHGAGGNLIRPAEVLLREPEQMRKFLEKMLQRAKKAMSGIPYWDIKP